MTRLRNLCLKLLCASFLVLGISTISAAQTETPISNWQICNETSFILRVATASIDEGKMSTRGWTRLPSGDCSTVDAPENTPRFVYAESDPVHQGGIREWKGKAILCADEGDFTSDATRECSAQNLSTRGYLQVDPAQDVTALIEPDDFGKKAANAGIQRLLSDNGYGISRIDGIMGRRTTRLLKSFLKDQELSNTVSDREKIDALAKSAGKLQDGVGLTLCNEAVARIWTAVAFRDKSGWESRGWWPIKSGECARPFTQNLKGKDVHYLAVLEQPTPADSEPNDAPPPDKKLKNIAPIPSQFCVAESQFSAIGREYCSDKGYRPENFRAVITEELGQKIILLDSDFIEQNPSGLRR